MTRRHACPNCGYIEGSPIPGLQFIAAARQVTMGGKSCHLSRMQIDILECLMDAYPRPVHTEALLEACYPIEADENRSSLSAMMSMMRKSLRDAGLPLSVTLATGTGLYSLKVMQEAA